FPHRIVIRGQDGRDATTIDGGSNGRPVVLISRSAHTVSISGVTFTGGSGHTDLRHPVSVGGAIALIHAPLRVEDCRFVANSASKGGALYVEVADAEVIGCEFIDNAAQDAGAIYVADGESTLTLADSLFQGNTADLDGGGVGGAI